MINPERLYTKILVEEGYTHREADAWIAADLLREHKRFWIGPAQPTVTHPTEGATLEEYPPS